jgi:hypothetical protein
MKKAMIPLQNIPRASRHCSSYRSLPLGEQQPWGLLLLGLTPVTRMGGRPPPLFTVYSMEVRSLRSLRSPLRWDDRFPTILAGFTRTKRQDSVHSSLVPALNLFQGDRPSYFGSFLYPLHPRHLGPWFIIFLILPDLPRQPLPLLPFSDLPGSSFV